MKIFILIFFIIEILYCKSSEFSTFLQPFHLNKPDKIIKELKSIGVTTVTFPIVWAEVEKKNKVYSFDIYDKYLDILVKNGFKLNLILDTSGRFQFDNLSGTPQYNRYSIPDWVYTSNSNAFVKDHTQALVHELDLYNKTNNKYLFRFYKEAVKYYISKYKNNIHTFALGIQSEFELKYGQNGYVWRNYSQNAQDSYSKSMNQYTKLPIINYNNNIANGLANVEKHFPSFMSFREDSLATHICRLSNVIRENGGKASGYFAETFTSHDAIYATGVIEEVVSCLDEIVVDYNFFDGYNRVDGVWIPSLLTNYAKNLGYPKVITGLYIERWINKNKENKEFIDDNVIEILSNSIENLNFDKHSDGIEIGGFPLDIKEMKKLHGLTPPTKASIPKKKYHIGILAAKSNYYLWHGERSYERNIHSDALIEAYKFFLKDSEFQVSVIGEKTIHSRPDIMSNLDALYLPHQTTIDENTENVLINYHHRGLKLIQDVRFSTFKPDGSFEGDWKNKIFGISHISWKNENEIFTYKSTKIQIEKQKNLYFSHAHLYPSPNYKVILPSKRTRSKGGLLLKGDNTLVLGFLLQLIEGSEIKNLKEIVMLEIKKLLDEK